MVLMPSEHRSVAAEPPPGPVPQRRTPGTSPHQPTMGNAHGSGGCGQIGKWLVSASSRDPDCRSFDDSWQRTVEETCTTLGISRTTLYRYVISQEQAKDTGIEQHVK